MQYGPLLSIAQECLFKLQQIDSKEKLKQEKQDLNNQKSKRKKFNLRKKKRKPKFQKVERKERQSQEMLRNLKFQKYHQPNMKFLCKLELRKKTFHHSKILNIGWNFSLQKVRRIFSILVFHVIGEGRSLLLVPIHIMTAL